MADNETEIHKACMQRFIDLANQMHNDEGVETGLVSAGLMTASAVYATFAVSGNDGGLNPTGVDKVTEAYKQQLEHVQKTKREQQARQQQ
tara:strand:- start:35302 stop:35571 length:270 start_codon:yes stop_codon:yes gene_type:complete